MNEKTTNLETELRTMMECAARLSNEIQSLRGVLSRIAADETVNEQTLDAAAALDETLNKARARMIGQAFRVLASHYPPPPLPGEEWKDSTQ